MKNLWATAAVAAVLSTLALSSAHAANTAIIIWNAADPSGFEAASGTGSASLFGSNFGGVTISASSVSKGLNPADLTEANLNIDNTTNTVQTIRIVAGANGYLGTSKAFALTGSFGVTSGQADLSGSFYADQSNSLNGLTTGGITGVDIGDFDSTLLSGPYSFAFNGLGLDHVTAPYGLAESLTLTLRPGASIFVQGVSMDASAVPEPSTWAMGLAGFGALGLFGFVKGRRQGRAIEA